MPTASDVPFRQAGALQFLSGQGPAAATHPAARRLLQPQRARLAGWRPSGLRSARASGGGARFERS